MSLFSRLFGGGGREPTKTEVTAVEYCDCRIYPDPIKEGSQHRVAARIEKDIDGETRTHQLIRADTIAERDVAVEASVSKAKQVIDEQGDRLFL